MISPLGFSYILFLQCMFLNDSKLNAEFDLHVRIYVMYSLQCIFHSHTEEVMYPFLTIINVSNDLSAPLTKPKWMQN